MSLSLRGRAIIRGINPSARALTRLIPLEKRLAYLLTYKYTFDCLRVSCVFVVVCFVVVLFKMLICLFVCLYHEDRS